MSNDPIDTAVSALNHTELKKVPTVDSVYDRARTHTRRRRVAVGVVGAACLALVVGVGMLVTREDNQTVTAQPGGNFSSSASINEELKQTRKVDFSSGNNTLKAWSAVGDLTLVLSRPKNTPQHSAEGELIAYRTRTSEPVWNVKPTNGSSLYTSKDSNVFAQINYHFSKKNGPYSIDHQELVVSDLATGGELWRVPIPEKIKADIPIQFDDLKITEDTLVILTDLSAFAYDARSGKLKWQRTVEEILGIPKGLNFKRAAINGDLLTIQASPKFDGPGFQQNNPWLTQLALADGAVKSVARIHTQHDATTHFAIELLTSVGPDVLIKKRIDAADASATVSYQRVRPSDGQAIWATPQELPPANPNDLAKAGLDEFFAASVGGNINTYDLVTGKLLWTIPENAKTWSWSGHGNNIYFFQIDNQQLQLVVANARTGERRQSIPLPYDGGVESRTIEASDAGVAVEISDKYLYIFAAP